MEKIAEEITDSILNWAKDNERWLTPTVVGALGAGVGAMGTGEQGIDETDGEYRARKLRNALILGGLAGGGTAAVSEGIRAFGDARPEEYKSDTTKAVENAGTAALPAAGAIGGGALGIGAGGFTARVMGDFNEATNKKILDAAKGLDTADESFIKLVNKHVPGGHQLSHGDILTTLDTKTTDAVDPKILKAIESSVKSHDGAEAFAKFMANNSIDQDVSFHGGRIRGTLAVDTASAERMAKGEKLIEELRALSKMSPRNNFAGGRIGRLIGKGVGGTVLGALGLGGGLLANHLLNSSEDNG